MDVSETQSPLIVLPQYIAVVILPGLLLPLDAQTVLNVFRFAISDQQIAIPNFRFRDKRILFDFIAMFLELDFQQVSIEGGVEVHPEFGQNLVEGVVLLLHLLVVAPALLCLPGSDEVGHAFEDFVGPAQMLQHEMAVVQFQEPVIQLVFFVRPVSFLYVFGLCLCGVVLEMWVLLLGFLLGLFPGEAYVTLLAEERFEVVAGDDLLVVFQQRVDLLRTVLIRLSMDLVQIGDFVPLGEVGLRTWGVLVCAFVVVQFGWQIELMHGVICSFEKYKSQNLSSLIQNQQTYGDEYLQIVHFRNTLTSFGNHLQLDLLLVLLAPKHRFWADYASQIYCFRLDFKWQKQSNVEGRAKQIRHQQLKLRAQIMIMSSYCIFVCIYFSAG